jgi:C1A family cysteine protease
MRLSRAALLLVFFAGAAFAENLRAQQSYMGKFLSWMKKFNMTFEDQDEFIHRFQIFCQSDDIIEAHNAKGESWRMGHNQFSHLTFPEFRQQVGLDRAIPEFFQNGGTGLRPLHQEREAVPNSIDWETLGAVTGVKDQGNCGSCWSFSATGGMEGAYFQKTGSLVSFSEQQLVSCDTTDSGCNGGLMDYAFEWIQNNGGICTEASYPYVSGTGLNPSCKRTCTEVSGTTPSKWTDVSKTESALKTAVAQQPVSVAIEADQVAFQYYQSGVLTGTCGNNLDHGVLAVGYGTDSGTDYWKVKNSWGTSWGEAGYVRIERNTGTYGGKCGITLSASYVSL